MVQRYKIIITFARKSMILTIKVGSFKQKYTFYQRNMNYIEVSLTTNPFSEEISDILAALMAPLEYDSFTTEGDALKAYCPVDKYSEETLEELVSSFPLPDVEIKWTSTEVVTQDWNAEWEETVMFEPIVIGDKCCIHGPKSTDVPECRYDVLIAPKMSFGSGHHETTAQLLEEILSLYETDSEKYAKVLDMGTGTAVLAILAALCGAKNVRAIEIDDWVADNARDNVLLNDLAGRIVVECGDASLLGDGQTYDLVLANINRNVLLADMKAYVADLNQGGILMMSGFYEEDMPMIRECAESLGMKYLSHRNRNNWVVAKFELL